MTSSEVVIRAEGLGKHYILGHRTAGRRDATFRDLLVRSARAWGRSARDLARGRAIIMGDQTETFWALHDLNFEIRRGDVVGIIGRNGAGKSTLLKILSRITEPSEGRVTIDGRVASLLEVGTGFHPELTGRENIYLNGAILGMSRAEIRRKFDEIVEFAGVERFLDTPVKRYSSGMYVRLAFSVAAHLEPEILIVDEVLAVGDAEFQNKCLGKMQDVAGHGRTVLFVSHNLSAIRRLCTHGIYLRDGSIKESASIDEVIAAYVQAGQILSDLHNEVTISGCKLCIEYKGGGLVRIAGRVDQAGRSNFTLGLTLQTLDGNHVLETSSADQGIAHNNVRRDFAFELALPYEHLRPGQYIVGAHAYLQNESWLVGKDDGPRIKIYISEPATSSPSYLLRPPGYGPIIAWRDVKTNNSDLSYASKAVVEQVT